MTEEERVAERRRKNTERVGAWQRANPDKLRASRLKRKYGITQADYDQMLERQNFRCAICSKEAPGGSGGWHVDHCHTTDVVRGLLCWLCNSGLGKFKDNPAALRQAAAYLEAAQCPSNISETSPSTVS